MTDSMKFGPEWLRNLSTDGQTMSAIASNANVSSNNPTCATVGGGNNSRGGVITQSQNTSRNMFPEFRYGREEMLSLFDKNCETPDILSKYKKIYIEKVQFPLALTPTTDDEVVVPGQTISARPIWMQRSPIGFSSSRGIGRGGLTDRGRMRGKMMYHPSSFQRSTGIFDEDGTRLLPTKIERNWSERNGTSDAFNPMPPGANDWSNSPNISPRKEHSNHMRNMENWRRGRGDELSGESEGWRNSSGNVPGPFGSNHRWARSTSWRDEEAATSGEFGLQSANTIQRSYSSISTTVNDRSGAYSSSVPIKNAQNMSAAKHLNRPLNYSSGHPGSQPGKGTLWNGGGGNINEGPECEDNLPEWATENPSESGGTFDATGAFHGCLEEEDMISHSSVQRSPSTPQKDSPANRDIDAYTKTGKTSEKENSASIENLENLRHEKNISEEVSSETKDITSPESNDRKERYPTEQSEGIPNEIGPNQEDDYNLKASNALKKPLDTVEPPKPSYGKDASNTRSELSVNLDKVADDMVERLIQDDDAAAHHLATVGLRDNFDEAKQLAASMMSGQAGIKKPFAAADLIKPTPAQQQQLPEHETAASTISKSVPGSFPGSPKALPSYIIMNQPPPDQHHLSLQAQHFASVSPLQHEVNAITPSAFWYYRDPQSKVQGPFTALEMTEWYRAGYFNENLFVRRSCDPHFRTLGDLIKICNGNMPFTHSHLLDVLEVSPKDQREELKGNVTAAADTLSAAVKNLSSVDMQQMLPNSFRTLQEEHIRRQKMLIYSELSKNDNFLRLSLAEKEAVVQQKLALVVLPEYLTSLTGLGNSLATLNPTAGTHLFDVISECSKKDNEVAFAQTQKFNSFCSKVDIEQFLNNTERHLHQTQTRHQTQPQFPAGCYEPNLNRQGSSNNANSDLLSDMNLHLYMANNSQQVASHPAKEINQDIIIANDFFSLPSSTMPTAHTPHPMIPMWNAAQGNPMHEVQTMKVPTQNNNHWKSDDPLLGIVNRIMPPSNVPQAADCIVPNSMWESQQVLGVGGPSDGRLGESPQMASALLKEAIVENKQNPVEELINTVGSANEAQEASKNMPNEQQRQQIQKLAQFSEAEGTQKGLSKKPKQQPTNAAKTKEENKQRTEAEDKRRRKEELKRQLVEEEKRRAQLFEEEKRRQMLEEKERQQQIQAQRRKAMLATAGDDASMPQTGMFKNLDERRVQTASVAPWSNQSITASSNSGPCFAEIQKAERRERRADQLRQMELMEKQIRASAIEPAESVLKWNSSSIPVKSIIEIQAEEAKQRMAAEAQQDTQRRKEQPQDQAVSSSLGSSSMTLVGPQSSPAWGNNKTWGNTSNSSSAGFWEDTVKYSSILTPSASTASNQNYKNAAAKGQAAGKSQQTSSNDAPGNNNQKPSRNLKKSQSVSVMQRNAPDAVPANAKNTKQASSSSSHPINSNAAAKSNGLLKQQNQQEKGAAADKKSQSSAKAIALNPSTAKDEYEQEFVNWCTKSLNNMNTKIDVPTFVTFLQDLESPFEVKDYIRMYLGESKEFNDFGKQFLDRRSKYRNLQRAQNAHNDDMCKPAPAITPSGNDSADSKGKKKAKKNKMTKLDARILGFSVTAAEGRLNVGDRDYAETS